eukprot:114129_1
MAGQAVASLASYVETCKKAFANKARWKEITFETIDEVTTRLTILAQAVDKKASLAETLKNSAGWASFEEDLAELKAQVEVESIYRISRKDRESRDESNLLQDNYRSRSRRKKKKKHGLNVDDLSDHTEYSEDRATDPVQADRAQTERNRQKQMVRSSVYKETEYISFTIRQLWVKEVFWQEAICNILSRAMMKPFDPSKFKSSRDFKYLGDPLLINVLMLAFFGEARGKPKDSPTLLAEYEVVETALRKRIPMDLVQVSPLGVNKILLSLFNNSAMKISTFLSMYETKLELIKSDVKNRIAKDFHYNLPYEICWDNYLATCPGGCGKAHSCPNQVCNGSDHKLFNCINMPLRTANKNRLRSSHQFIENRNQFNNRRYRGRGRGRYYRPRMGMGFQYQNNNVPRNHARNNAPRPANNGQ